MAHRSVYEARNKKSRFSRLSDGKRHEVVVRRLDLTTGEVLDLDQEQVDQSYSTSD